MPQETGMTQPTPEHVAELLAAGTPALVVSRLNAEITKIVSRPDTASEWAKQGGVAMTMTPDAFGKFVADDIGDGGVFDKIYQPG